MTSSYSFPFKGKVRMGMGSEDDFRVRPFPFKGKVRMGMG